MPDIVPPVPIAHTNMSTFPAVASHISGPNKDKHVSVRNSRP